MRQGQRKSEIIHLKIALSKFSEMNGNANNAGIVSQN